VSVQGAGTKTLISHRVGKREYIHNQETLAVAVEVYKHINPHRRNSDRRYKLASQDHEDCFREDE
jgi:hypothetical protein